MYVAEAPSLGQIIKQAMRLEPSIYVGVQSLPHAIWLALAIVGLASLSESMGQSVVLFINQVRPRRFVLALGISSLSNFVGYLLWTLTVWLVVRFVFSVEVTLLPVGVAVGLAYAPQLLAFFELTPFIGNPFAVLLSLWSMLAIIVAMIYGLGLEPWQAVVAGLLGWMLIQVWRRSLGKPIYALGRSLQRRAAGKPMLFGLEDLPRIRHDSVFIESLMRGREVFSRPNIHELARRTSFGARLAVQQDDKPTAEQGAGDAPSSADD